MRRLHPSLIALKIIFVLLGSLLNWGGDWNHHLASELRVTLVLTSWPSEQMTPAPDLVRGQTGVEKSPKGTAATCLGLSSAGDLGSPLMSERASHTQSLQSPELGHPLGFGCGWSPASPNIGPVSRLGSAETTFTNILYSASHKEPVRLSL